MKLDPVNLQGDKVSIGLTAVLAVILTLQVLPKHQDQQDKVSKPVKDMVMKDRRPLVRLKSVTLPAPPPPPPKIPATHLPKAAPEVAVQKKAIVVEPEPTRDQKPVTQQVPQKTIKVDTAQAEMVQEGRVLLKMLEVGKGPNVEIAWPSNSQQREVLYRTLSRCFGLQSAVMNSKGQIYLVTGKQGQAAIINQDKVSLFLRQSTGQLPMSEKRTLSSIRQRHGLSAGQPVRLFNRNVDAALLGALFRLVPETMSDSPQIRASYGLAGGGIRIKDIIVDGTPVAGQVDVGFSLLGKCR